MQTSSSSSNAIVRWYPLLTLLTGALVLLQAVLAGRGWFIDYDLIEVHGWLGNLTFIFAIVLVVGAWLGKQAKQMTNAEFLISLLLLILTAAQFGLGYGGRDSQTAAALHIPNGVLDHRPHLSADRPCIRSTEVNNLILTRFPRIIHCVL